MTPIMLSLTVYYIPLVKNNLLTSLSAVLCTKIINVLVMIFPTTHSPLATPTLLNADFDEAPAEGGCSKLT